LPKGFQNSVPISDWPERDRKAWGVALEPGSILENPGRLSHLHARTIPQYRSSYGRWLRYLLSQDFLDEGGSGIDLLSPDVLRGYVAMLRSNIAPISVAIYVEQLGRVARIFQPEADWRFIHSTVRQLNRRAKLVSSIWRPCVSSIELYNLGLKLMRGAEARPTPIRCAKEFRSGLVISFLAARPLRLRNLAMILLNQHLELRGEAYWVHFEPQETKGRRHLDFPWPQSLHRALSQYLKVYRPVLVGAYSRHHPPDNLLWAVGYCQLHRIIKKKTGEWSGHPINPHRFRHAAATSIAIADPVHVGIIMPILGHSSSSTAELYYNRATSIEAARCYQQHIAELQRSRSRR
jgi:integrase/recombinase XerD